MFDGSVKVMLVYRPRTVRHFTSVAFGLDRATSLDHAPVSTLGYAFCQSALAI